MPNLMPEPSILINTGHGVQCYWLLTEKRQPAELRELVGDNAMAQKNKRRAK